MKTAPCIVAAAAAVWASLATATPAFADLADEIAACEPLDFSGCPPLQQAAASRRGDLKHVAAKLAAEATPPPVKAKLALALSLLDAREHSDAVEAAAAKLKGGPELAEIRAAQARLGDVRAVPGLLQLAAPDRDLHDRLLAVGSLGLLRAAEGLPVLLQALADGKSGQLQAEAARALGSLGNRAAEDPLLAVAGAPTQFAPARAAALQALSQLGSARGATLAALMADHPQAQVALAALELLRKAWRPWMAPAVRAAVELPGLRGPCARVAHEHDLAEVAPQLLQALVKGQLEPEELGHVLGAIGHLKPMGGAAQLVGRLKAAPKAEKIEIFRALVKFGDRTVVPDLVPWLEDADNQVVANSVYALENLTGRNLGPDVHAWRQYAGLESKAVPADH